MSLSLKLENFDSLVENGLSPEQAKELLEITKSYQKQIKLAKKEGNNETLQHFLGQPMPNAEDIERAVIGVMMSNPKKIDTVLRILNKEHFFNETWKTAFEVIVKMYREGRKIDLLTVTDYVTTKKIVELSPYSLVEATKYVTSDNHIDYWMIVVYDKFVGRKLLEIAWQLPQDISRGKDLTKIIEETQIELRKLVTLNEGEVKSPDIYIPETIEAIEKELARGDEINGTPFLGIYEIDYALNGIEDGDFMVVAARPKMGKTATFVGHAIAFMQLGMPLLMMSREIPNKDIVKRMVSVISDTDITDIRHNRYSLSDEYVKAAFDAIYESKIYLSDKSLSMKSLRDRVSEYYDKGVRRFAVDRFELFQDIIYAKDKNSAREQLATEIRQMINDYGDIAILMSAQMSSAHERTGSKRPSAVDVFGATALQSNCTKMLGLFRPDQVGSFVDEKGNDLRGKVEVLFLAGNNIPNGNSVWLDFDKKTASLKKLDNNFLI